MSLRARPRLARPGAGNPSHTDFVAGTQSFVGGIAKPGFKRRCQELHAEHTDIMRLNDLAGRVIGRALTALNTLGAGSWNRSTTTRYREIRATLAPAVKDNVA